MGWWSQPAELYLACCYSVVGFCSSSRIQRTAFPFTYITGTEEAVGGRVPPASTERGTDPAAALTEAPANEEAAQGRCPQIRGSDRRAAGSARYR